MKIDTDLLKGTPRNSDNFLREYVKYTEHMEAPRQYHMWTAISIIAGALRSKCHIDMGYFKWKPNQFIIFVAPPGIVSKSTTSGVGTELLREVPGINFGPGSCTWQALFSNFVEVEERFKVGRKNIQTSCLTVEASELGTFLDFNNGEMVDTIVDIWDAKDKATVRRTVGGGEQRIEGAWLNLIACTTPSWIAQSMPQYAIGGGFTSRCVFVYADTKEKLVAYPTDHLPKGQASRKKALVEDLTRISMISGAFKLDKEAKKFGDEWYVNHNKNQAEHLKSDLLAGYSARKQTHMHKVAMCLSAAESDSRIITKSHMETALALLSFSEQNMVKVFDTVTDDREANNLGVLKQVILKHRRGITRTDLLYQLSSRLGYDAIIRALDAGVATGVFDSVTRQQGIVIKPTPRLIEASNNAVGEEEVATINKIME